MTPRQALALARSLRSSGATAEDGCALNLEAFIQDGRVVFSGGRYGGHCLSIEASTPERIKAHWEGYVEQSGGIVRRVCPTRCIVDEDLTSSKYVSRVCQVIVGPDGGWSWIVRRVTRSTGHHVFFRVTETGNAHRIASDTSACRLYTAAPKYLVRALCGYGTDNGRVHLRSARMSDADVARMKRTLRAEKAPYGVGIYR